MEDDIDDNDLLEIKLGKFINEEGAEMLYGESITIYNTSIVYD